MHPWTINGRFASQPVTGVQRYAAQIVQAIDRQLADAAIGRRPDVDMVVPRGTEVPFELAHIRVRTVGRMQGHFWEQVELPRFARGGLLSLANTGPLVASPHIVCIHDANTRLCPESYSFPFRALYRGLHPALGHRAGSIATVSEFSAGELGRLGIAPASRIFVAPNGHEHALAWNPQHTTATRGVAGPGTIVVLGSAAPHKNIGMLLDLAPQLADHGMRLAITGMTDSSVFASRSRQPRANANNVHWLGRISDDALAAIFDDCLCLAFPSLTEGFGLPPLEAMARGCPVVVSDRASLPEICGPAALYAAPDQPAAWLAHFRRLHTDAASRHSLVTLGRARAKNFSWTRSAAIYMDMMFEPAVSRAAAR